MAAKWGKKSKEIVGGTSPPAAVNKPERISNSLDHVLVAESKPLTPKQRAKTYARRAWVHKPFLVVAAILLMGGTGLALYLGRDKPEQQAAQGGPKCTYRMLEAAKPNLVLNKDSKKTAAQITQLESQVKGIEQTPGFDQDVNCLYVVVTYYGAVGNAQKSREYYDKLAVVYDPTEGYATVIIDVAVPLGNIRRMVESLEKKGQNVSESGERYQGIKIDPATGGPAR